MGTMFRLVLYAPDAETAERAASAAFARIDALNAILSDYDPASELSRLSPRGASTEPLPVSAELFEVLAHAQGLARESDGAFDVTVGPIARLWRRARRRGELPSDERLRAASVAVGHAKLELDAELRTVRLLVPEMSLDLGAIAKGYALDEALAALRRHGIERALIDGGGDVVVGRAPPGRNGWRVGLIDFEGERGGAGLEVAAAAVATSGDLARFVELDGVRYSHLIDPRSAQALTERRLVTVVVSSGPRPGMRADALASAIAVLGARAGLALIEGDVEVAARVVTRIGGRSVVSESPGFAGAVSSWAPHHPRPDGPTVPAHERP